MLNKILITGGTGFIGTNFVKELVKLGCSPTIISRNIKNNTLNKTFAGKVDFIELDLCDFEKTRDFIKKNRPDLIVNLAGTNNKNDQDDRIFEKLNFKAAVNLFEIAREINVKRFIQIGTADEYGCQTTPQKETFDLQPKSAYSSSKANATKYGLSMFNESKFPIVILRPFTVYGFGQPNQMFLNQLIYSALRNETFRMTEGNQKRDYIFIKDMVAAIISASFEKNIEGEVFNIGSGVAFPLREIAKKVWNITGADSEMLQVGFRKANDSELLDTFADITKAKKMLEWHPEVSLDEGLNQTIEAIKKVLRLKEKNNG